LVFTVEVHASRGLSSWAQLLAMLPADAASQGLTRALVANAVAGASASLDAGDHGVPHSTHDSTAPGAEAAAHDPAATAHAEPGTVVAIEPSATSWPSHMLLTPAVAQAEQARAAQNYPDSPLTNRTLAQPQLSDPLTAAAPLTTQWVSNLVPVPLSAWHWPHPARPQQAPEDEPRPRHRHGRDAEPEAWQDEADEPIEELTTANATGTTAATKQTNPHTRFTAELPQAVHAELARKRCVLVLGPCPVTAQRPSLDAWWLSFDAAGRPQAQRCAARGALGVTTALSAQNGEPSAWQLWRARRHGQPGDANSDNHAALTPRRRADMPLVVRVGDLTRPPPLRDAHSAWLDLLAPQRLWRDMGTQWTLLIAWHSEPL
jgi:hypothetical protein